MSPKQVQSIEHIINGKQAFSYVNVWKDDTYLCFRFCYETNEGQLRWAKQGINIPLNHGLEVICSLLQQLNEATGSTLIIGSAEHTEGRTADQMMEEVAHYPRGGEPN